MQPHYKKQKKSASFPVPKESCLEVDALKKTFTDQLVDDYELDNHADIPDEIKSDIDYAATLTHQLQEFINMKNYGEGKSLRMSDGDTRLECDKTKDFIVNSLISSLQKEVSRLESVIEYKMEEALC